MKKFAISVLLVGTIGMAQSAQQCINHERWFEGVFSYLITYLMSYITVVFIVREAVSQRIKDVIAACRSLRKE